MKLILCSLLLSLASGAVLIGKDECSWGPSYWCSGIPQAKQCHAVKHCMGTVWKYQVLQPRTSEACAICSTIVDEARQLLKNKAVDDEIASVLAKVCSLLPAGDIRTECKGIVSEDLPILLEMLAKDISSTTVCATLHVCTGLQDRTPHMAAETSETTTETLNTTCQDCKRFIKDIQEMVTSNATAMELIQLLEQTLCAALGPLEKFCKEGVEMVIPDLLGLLSAQINPDVTCRVFGFCSVTNLDSPVLVHIPMKNVFAGRAQTAVGFTSSEECSICVEVITELDSFLRDKTIQDKVKGAVEDYVCGSLGSLKDQCIQLVEEYSLLVFDLLINELDPKTVCTSVGFCNSTGQYEAMKSVLLTSLETFGGNVNGGANPDLQCELCQKGIGLAEELLQNISSDTLMSAFHAICSFIEDGTLKSKCDQYVAQYGPLIIEVLQTKEDPNAICKLLLACKTQKTVPMALMTKAAPLPEEAPVSGIVECEACKGVVQELLDTLGQDPTQAKIEAELDKICARTPYKEECDAIVQVYTPVIINLILNKASASTICKAVKLCTATVNVQAALRAIMSPNDLLPVVENFEEKTPAPVKKVDSGEYCTICELVMAELDNILKGNESEEEVNAALKKVCDLLPTAIAEECKGFVNLFAPLIVEKITEDPKKFCTEVGFCSARSLSPMAAVVQLEKATVMGAVECDVCKMVVQEVDTLLANNMTDEEIIAGIKKVCSVLPENISAQCNAFVEQYGLLVIQLLEKELDPSTVCQYLGMCTTQKLSRPISAIANQPSGKGVKMPVFACLLCDVVLKELDSLLQEKRTQTLVRSALDKVCTILPTSMQADCTVLINTFYEPLLNYLILNIDPDKICEDLTLCTPPTDMKAVHMLSQSLKSGQVQGVECTFCKEGVIYLKQFVSENTTEEELLEMVKEYCNALPDTISQQCKDLADEYVPALLALLKSELDPTQVCQSLGLCNSTAKVDTTMRFQRPQKLGEKKCTYGPAYWCASMKNAKECNAEAHCRRHVWNVL